MKKLLIILVFLLSFYVANAVCDFPYKEGVDSCSPAAGRIEGLIRWVEVNAYGHGTGMPSCGGSITLYVPRVPYVALQIRTTGTAPPSSVEVFLNDVKVGDVAITNLLRGYLIVNLANCLTDVCKISIPCRGYTSYSMVAEAGYILDSRFTDGMMQNAYYNYLDFSPTKNPFIVAAYGGNIVNVSVTYGNGIALFQPIPTAYPVTGYYRLRYVIGEEPDGVFYYNYGSFHQSYTVAIDIYSSGMYEWLYIFYPDLVNLGTLMIRKYVNFSLVKEAVVTSDLRAMNVFWVDRKHKLAGIGDAFYISSYLFGVSKYMRIDIDFFPSKIKAYEMSIYQREAMSPYYQTFLVKHDIPRLSIDVYYPRQFYNLVATTYSLTTTTRVVSYIGEKIRGVQDIIYSFGVRTPFSLDTRRAFVYSPQLGFLANATIVNGLAIFSRPVELNPVYDYYILVEWNANTYPTFDSNDYKDDTRFVYCYSLAECVETTYDFPMLINEVVPTGTYTQIYGRVYGGVPPFHVCVNGTIDTSPFSYCYDYVEREFMLLGLQPIEPKTLTLRANVTDNVGVYAESSVFSLKFVRVVPVYDVIVNYHGRDYHYNQYIEINTTSEELMSGKQFVFWVREVVGVDTAYTTLVCGPYNVTKVVPGTITLGIETSGDLSISYEDFVRMSYDHPLYTNTTHYAKFTQCVFVTKDGFAITGPTINFYNFIPKVPLVPITINLTLDKTSATVNEKVTATVSVSGGTPPYKIKVYELIYKYDICEWVAYAGNSLDLYFSFPCPYSACERTYYLIASVTDSLAAGATSPIRALVISSGYNTTNPETIYVPNCPGIIGGNITPGLPGVPPVPIITFPTYTESIFKLTELARQYNVTGPALVGVMIIDRILTLAGIATLITVFIGAFVGYYTKSGQFAILASLLLVLLFTILGFYPWWLGIVFIIIAGLIVTLLFKGAF